jgi:hypothetical protein
MRQGEMVRQKQRKEDAAQSPRPSLSTADDDDDDAQSQSIAQKEEEEETKGGDRKQASLNPSRSPSVLLGRVN